MSEMFQKLVDGDRPVLADMMQHLPNPPRGWKWVGGSGAWKEDSGLISYQVGFYLRRIDVASSLKRTKK